ncbi:hypothetical protein STENM223S_10118 [Streptomyces tendae]
MTQVTPPGWYPDPGQTQDAPPTERWWDGTAWTARIRRTDTDPATQGAQGVQDAPAGPADTGLPSAEPVASWAGRLGAGRREPIRRGR